MKIEISQKVLQRSLSQALSFGSKKGTIQILDYGLVKPEDECLMICSTNMEHSAVIRVSDVYILDEGDPVLWPLSMMYDVVRKLPSDKLILIESIDDEAAPRFIKITCGRFFTKINTLDPLDFPAITDWSSKRSIRFDCKDLLAAIKKVDFAISSEETRYYLNGIYFNVQGKDCVMVATDGHRLSLCHVDKPVFYGDNNFSDGVIIPRDFVSKISTLLDREGKVDLSFETSKICLKFPEIKVSSKLIEGKFPEYERVIPKNNDRYVVIHSGELGNIVGRVSVIETERSRPVKFSFINGCLEVLCSSKDGHNAQDQIDVDSAFSLDIGFQARYILDILSAHNTTEMTWFFGHDEGSPCVVKPSFDSRDLCVLMPMRV